MEDSDVLIVPAGGGDLISPEQAGSWRILGLKLVIPVQYQTPAGDAHLGTLDAFCKALGVEIPVPEDKLGLQPGSRRRCASWP